MLQNQGEEISLRLRTDDLKGFRKYESIKKTLLHELVGSFGSCLINCYCFVIMVPCIVLTEFFSNSFYLQAHMVYSEHDADFFALDKQVWLINLAFSIVNLSFAFFKKKKIS